MSAYPSYTSDDSLCTVYGTVLTTVIKSYCTEASDQERRREERERSPCPTTLGTRSLYTIVYSTISFSIQDAGSLT